MKMSFCLRHFEQPVDCRVRKHSRLVFYDEFEREGSRDLELWVQCVKQQVLGDWLVLPVSEKHQPDRQLVVGAMLILMAGLCKPVAGSQRRGPVGGDQGLGIEKQNNGRSSEAVNKLREPEIPDTVACGDQGEQQDAENKEQDFSFAFFGRNPLWIRLERVRHAYSPFMMLLVERLRFIVDAECGLFRAKAA